MRLENKTALVQVVRQDLVQVYAKNLSPKAQELS